MTSISLLNLFKEKGIQPQVDGSGKNSFTCVINGQSVLDVTSDPASPNSPVSLRIRVATLPSKRRDAYPILESVARLNAKLSLRGYGLVPSYRTGDIDLLWLYPSNSSHNEKEVKVLLRHFVQDALTVGKSIFKGGLHHGLS